LHSFNFAQARLETHSHYDKLHETTYEFFDPGATMRLIFIAIALLFFAKPASSDPIRLTTWNIGNLWHVPNEALRTRRDGSPGDARRLEDYSGIRSTIAGLSPDILALQEIGSPEAANKVLPPDYQLVFSARYKPLPRDIYTALAIKTGKVKILQPLSIPELALKDSEGYSLRYGTGAVVQVGAMKFAVMSVHLKSGCQRIEDPATYKNPEKPYIEEACQLLLQQAPILERWIEATAALMPVVVMGDFNRVFTASDKVWADLDDGQPKGLDLYAVPFGKPVLCSVYRSTPQQAIDHIVVDQRLQPFLIVPENPMTDIRDKRLSDHCPVSAALNLE
jgi:endonuclease/exonuclease/phosphatase family metal-dependent hydrolase